jgi:PiT family inorganic phosphate transporter
LILALGLAFGFEFVNRFHDTANAVATVIYTHTLKPVVAVVWSGLCNLAGVLTSSGTVALLPVELVLNVGSGAGFAIIFSLLLSAILWNLGTWYMGLPASSSHTLVGAIMGVGPANSLLTPGHAGDAFASLIVSPILGFVLEGARKRTTASGLDSGTVDADLYRRELLSWLQRWTKGHGSGGSHFGGAAGNYALNPAAKKEDLQKIVTYSQQVQPALDKLRQGDERKGQTAAGDLSDFLKAKVPRPRRRTPRWPARMTTSVMNLKVETATVT